MWLPERYLSRCYRRDSTQSASNQLILFGTDGIAKTFHEPLATLIEPSPSPRTHLRRRQHGAIMLCYTSPISGHLRTGAGEGKAYPSYNLLRVLCGVFLRSQRTLSKS